MARILAEGKRRVQKVTLGIVLVAISASSSLGGPYIIMPAFLAAFATATMATTPPAMQRPLLWSGMCFVAATVPIVLLALDLLPVGFALDDKRMLIEFQVANTSPAIAYIVLAVCNLLAIFLPMSVTYHTARQLHDTRARLLLHVWHLRSSPRRRSR